MSRPDIQLTADQDTALQMLREFASSADERCFMLKGYAGTGKTFLIGRFVQWLHGQGRSAHLLAPTGRAARVIGDKTGFPGSTIHRFIYNLDELIEHDEKDARFKFYFQLKASALDDTRSVILVDESSMISDRESEGEFIRFGSGRLLKDLIEYARLRDPTQKSKIVFVGDPAQLPPVGMNTSPALDTAILTNDHAVTALVYELKQVVRQRAESRILAAATAIRRNLETKSFNQLVIEASPPEIVGITSDDVASMWQQRYRPALPPQMVCITYANDTALRYNLLIRAKIFGGTGDQSVREGDFLMVITNNRFTGLLNGDLALVLRADSRPVQREVPIFVDGKRERVQLSFRGVTIAFDTPNSGLTQMDCRILENVLFSDRRDLSPEEQRALYVDFKIRFPELRPNTKAFTEALVEDEYFNALRVKFGYAATCHKAQGGEWNDAAVVFEYQRTDSDAQRWTYTAITRAKERLFGVNLPSKRPWDGILLGVPPLERPPTLPMPDSEEPPRKELKGEEQSAPLAGGPAHLNRRHAAALRAWEACDISVTSFDPQIAKFYVRYVLSQQGKTSVLQVYFKKSGTFNVQIHPGSDPILAEQARGAFITAESAAQDEEAPEISFPADKPFLRQLYEEYLRPRAEQAGASITAIIHLQYRERVVFARSETKRAAIDFIYDGRGRFTDTAAVPGETTDPELITAVLSKPAPPL